MNCLEVTPVRARDLQVGALIDALTTELAASGYAEDETFGYTIEELERSGRAARGRSLPQGA